MSDNSLLQFNLMDSVSMYQKLDDAIVYATKCHSGQLRKVFHIPYILHPMEVATIISSMTPDEDLIIAGLLHDVIEECNVDAKEIKELFGARVAALVQSETEDKLAERPPGETWVQRKEESLLMLQMTPDLDVKILWLGDKLSNIRSFNRTHEIVGDAMWNNFNMKDPKMHEWYFREIAKYTTELAETAAYREYVMLVNQLFGEEDQNQ
ncbi:MAG: HD domain-containing protein [Erysipelotrichaceae bacterium]|nr:HD domain-containing protein [Erysipelotrichaceae bacterium]